METNKRWSKEEELKIIKEISHGKTIPELAKEYNRSENALELRLKKIIYENHISGKKSFEQIAQLLKMSVDKITQYHFAYKDFLEKHNQHVAKPNIVGGNNGNNGNIENKIDKKLKKIETENKIIKMVIENKILKSKLQNLIVSGQIDKNILNAIHLIVNYEINK